MTQSAAPRRRRRQSGFVTLAAIALLSGLLLSSWSTAHAHEPESQPPPAAIVAPESPVTPSGHPASASTPRTTVITGPIIASVQPTSTTATNRMAWPNKVLLVTGAAVFGAAYLPAIAGGALSDEHLYVPIAGPWLMLTRGGADEMRWAQTLLVIDGVGQWLGVLLLVSSLLVPPRATKQQHLIGATQSLVAPSRVGTGYGLSAHARF